MRLPLRLTHIPGRRMASTILGAIILLTGVVPVLAQATPVTSDTPSNPAAAYTPEIHLTDCEAEAFVGAQCGTVTVPMDWSQPDGETTDLALVVRPADKQDERLGVMLLNNGSGGAAIEQLRLALAQGGIIGPLTDHFDLVAVDPRGVGESTPVTCNRPQRSEGITYFPQTQEEFDAMVADNRALAEACREGTGAVFDHLDEVTSAHDLDAVRRALGEDQVIFYGIQHTALVGRTYARLYPDKLQGMILDTVLDDSVPVAQQLATEVVAVETALNRYAAWCAESEDCSLHGQDVLEVFESLVVQADREPIPADGRPSLTGEDIRRVAQEHLVHRFAWLGFGPALQQAIAGDATALASNQSDGTLVYLQDHAVRCATTPAAAETFDELKELERMVQELAPMTGGASRAWDSVAGCIGWPNRPEAVDPGTPAKGAPPALILQSTHNSLASYQNAFSLVQQLPGSQVLSREGDDYSIILFSPCVATAAVGDYLIGGQLPAPGTICRD